MQNTPTYKNVGNTIILIENAIFDLEVFHAQKPNYEPSAIRGGIKIFMSVIMDAMYNLQEAENMDMEDKMNMAESLGKELRALVKKYTDIDTHTLYK